MSAREQKVAELLEDFHSLKHSMIFHPSKSAILPRITPSQWHVLMIIGRHAASTVKDIAVSLQITSSAATQLIDGLVESGYVIREPSKEDRRIVQLKLTKKTEVHTQKIQKQFLQKMIELFDVLDDQEFETYVSLNKKITKRFKK